MQAGQWVVASRITTGTFLLTKFRENSSAVGNSNSSVTVEPKYKSVWRQRKKNNKILCEIVSNRYAVHLKREYGAILNTTNTCRINSINKRRRN